MSESGQGQLVLKGIGASPGICIGKAYLVDQEGVDVVGKYHIDGAMLQNEKNRFKMAVQKAREELKNIIENTPEELREHADILATHVVLLKDKMLYAKTIEVIDREKVNAEWALKTVLTSLKSMFDEISDAYLRERASDIVNVSDRIMRHLLGAPQVNIAEIDKRVILIARDLSPAETSQINLERIRGLATDLGGRSSHTAIIARTLELPAVLGLTEITKRVKNDDIIIVDGSEGTVILNPTEQALVKYGEKQAAYEFYTKMMIRGSHQIAETTDGLHVPVMGNIELPEEVVSVIDHGGEGVGLYRTEFQYLNRTTFPEEDELFDKYRDVVEVMEGKPVTIRTIDINGDKAVNPGLTPETNPALGLRAIRYCLKNPHIFEIQIRAIMRAAAFGNVRILLPMISNVEEVIDAKKIIAKAAGALKHEGKSHEPHIEIGVMLEVPSAVVMADAIAEHIDFFSIGTNDLIQYALAIDRVNSHVAHLYNPLNPAVIRMLNYISAVTKKKGTRLYMCGEMAGDPISIPILIGLGIDELSMTPISIPVVKKILRQISVKESKAFVDRLLKETTIKGVTDLVWGTYGEFINGQQKMQRLSC